MADMIKCPVCGENNPAEQEYCQYCQSRLQPQAGSSNTSIKPGQFPTKKNTAELEPILPQWLRDARDSARKSAEEDATQAAAHHSQSLSSSTPDLLAGLHSQKDNNDEEETPDWLANITGSAPKSKKPQVESSEVRWVELGDAKDFAKDEESETPDWLAGLTPTDAKTEEKDELSDWFRTASNSDLPPQPTKPAPLNVSPANDDSDWLKQIAADSLQDDGSLFNDDSKDSFQETPSDDTPDWLRQMAAQEDAKNTPPTFSESKPASSSLPSSGTPDWLRQMATQDDPQSNPPIFAESKPASSSLPPSDTPDWLQQMASQDGEQNQEPAASNSASFASSPSDAPDWLKKMSTQDNAAGDSSLPGSDSVSSIDTPDWLRAMGGVQPDQAQSADIFSFPESGLSESEANATGPSSDENVPDWLKGLPSVESDSSIQGAVPAWLKEDKPSESSKLDTPSWLSSTPSVPDQPAASEPDIFSMNDQASLGDIPSWLQAAAPQASVYDAPPSELPSATAATTDDAPDWLNTFKSVDSPKPTPAFSMDEPVESTPAAFTENPLDENKADSLFTDLPDWLSNATDASPTSNPTPITNTDAIAPGELPSWVQAMRPVDTNPARSASTSFSSDQTLESRGALAGLQGVLPSVPGYAPTSKPKAYSIKLQSSDEQQSHAALLEQILAAETEPVPIASFSALRNSRSLRWALSAVFLIVLTTILITRTQIFSLPVGAPNEIGSAWNIAQSIPEGAPVLVAFDYEPARVGEMEAVAAPLFNLLRKPSLTFVSTSETGALLAERFTSESLSGINTEGQTPYLNAGYLPGGQMGIRAFSQNPSTVMPQITGINSFNQFAAFIIITDNADDARTWIEQTSLTRGNLPIVVVSSAQAAPMIQPYFESGQVNGLVSGLYGSAVLESNNAGGPGTARIYWDAFSIGMLLAMVFILGGGLVSLALGLRDRAAKREEK